METNLTLSPVLLARDLAGTSGLDRVRRLRAWESAFIVAICACADDTARVLNGMGSLAWIRRQIELACGS